MSLPSVILTSASFNTWLDATNNVITHLANTSAFILLSQNATPDVSSGNASVNGVFTISQLVVNSSANLAGTTINASANINFTGQTINVYSNAAFTGATLDTSSNVTITGAFLNVTAGSVRVGGTANLQGLLNVTGNTTLSGANNFLTGQTTANTLTIDGLATVNTVTASGVATFNSNTVINGRLITNNEIILSGPISAGSGFVYQHPSTLSGSGPWNNLATGNTGISNVVIYRLKIDTAATVTGLAASNTSIYRKVLLVNVGDYDVTLAHETSSTTTNRFLCPANTNYLLPTQAGVWLLYDANASVQRWRILSDTPSVIPSSRLDSNVILTTSTTGINASALSTGTVPLARLDSNVILTTSTTGINASALSVGTIPIARLSSNVILTTTTTGINASALSTGTVPLARLDSNVILTTSTTGINASAISTGNIPVAQLPTTGVNASTITTGLINSGLIYDANTIVAGLVNTSAQSWIGVKTFKSLLIANNGLSVTGSSPTITAVDQTLTGFLYIGGKLYFDTTGRMVLPVGTDMWAS